MESLLGRGADAFQLTVTCMLKSNYLSCLKSADVTYSEWQGPCCSVVNPVAFSMLLQTTV